MNFMYAALMSIEFPSKKKTLNEKVNKLKEILKKEKIKILDKGTKIGTAKYYYNALPLVSDTRDVLKKPNGVCKIWVNWKKKKFDNNMTSSEVMNSLKEQWGWSTITVDAEHTRNVFKNKEILWAVFDNEKEAIHNMHLFNSMFTTAIEQDAIDEYKKFKESPDKRPLTFDKLVENAYELYEAVDNGEV